MWELKVMVGSLQKGGDMAWEEGSSSSSSSRWEGRRMGVEEVGVVAESSWHASQGSLLSTLHILTHEDALSPFPIPLPSLHPHPLILVPPPHQPHPCQITVKFLQRLYHVHGIYILSTSRTCELYSQITTQEDPEYVCTVRGWVPEQPDFSNGNSEETATNKLSTTLQLHSVHQDLRGIGTTGERNKDDPNGKLGISALYRSQLSHNRMKDMKSATNMSASQYYDGMGNEGSGYNKSTSSSSDSSWVEIPGSFVASSCEPELVEDLQNQVHGELDATQLIPKDADLQIDEQEARGAIQSCGNGEINNICTPLLHSKENIHICGDSVETKLALVGQECISSASYYEVDFELVDSEAWEALTLRLLSLQDKSSVKVLRIVFLVSPGPLAPISKRISEGNSALLGMLIPNMLQMIRHNEHTFLGGRESLSNLENVTRLNKATSSKSEERERCKTEGCSVSGKFSETSFPEILLVDERVTQLESLPQTLPTHLSLMDVNSDLMASQVRHGHSKNRVDGGNDLYDCDLKEETETQNPVQVKDDVKRPAKTTRESCLENIAERFDKLEQLCLRMESFLHRAVECLDRRIQILEAYHVKNASMQNNGDLTGKDKEVLDSNISMQKIEHATSEEYVAKEILQNNENIACEEYMQEDKNNAGMQNNEDAPNQESQDKEVLGSDIGIQNIEKAPCEEYLSKTVLDSSVIEGLTSCQSSSNLEHLPVVRRHETSLHDAWSSALEAFSADCVTAAKGMPRDCDMHVTKRIIPHVESENLKLLSGGSESSTSFFQFEDQQFDDPVRNVSQKQTHDGSDIQDKNCDISLTTDFVSPAMYEYKKVLSNESESIISVFIQCGDEQFNHNYHKFDDLVSNVNERWTQDTIDIQAKDNPSFSFSGEASVLVSNEHFPCVLQDGIQDPVYLSTPEAFLLSSNDFYSITEETHQVKPKEEDLLGSNEIATDCFEVDCSNKINILSLSPSNYNQKSSSSANLLINFLDESDKSKQEAVNRDDCDKKCFSSSPKMLSILEDSDGFEHSFNVNMINVLESDGIKHREMDRDIPNQKKFSSDVNMINVLEYSDGCKHKAIGIDIARDVSDLFQQEEMNGNDCNQKSSSSNINTIDFIEEPYWLKHKEVNRDDCNHNFCSSNVNMINSLEAPDCFNHEEINEGVCKISFLDVDCDQVHSTVSVNEINFMEESNWVDHEEMNVDGYDRKCSSNVDIKNFLEQCDGFNHEAVSKDNFTAHVSIGNHLSGEDVSFTRKGFSAPENNTILLKELGQVDYHVTFSNLECDQGMTSGLSFGQNFLEPKIIFDCDSEIVLSNDQDNLETSPVHHLDNSQQHDICSNCYFPSLGKDSEQNEHTSFNFSIGEECKVATEVPVQNMNPTGVHQILPQIPYAIFDTTDFLSSETTMAENLLFQQTESCVWEEQGSLIVFPGFEGL